MTFSKQINQTLIELVQGDITQQTTEAIDYKRKADYWLAGPFLPDKMDCISMVKWRQLAA
jgi:hypothetical protein